MDSRKAPKLIPKSPSGLVTEQTSISQRRWVYLDSSRIVKTAARIILERERSLDRRPAGGVGPASIPGRKV